MAPSFHSVPVHDIALDDQSFVVTYRPAMDALQRSVSRAGILTPLHLRRSSATARLQLICGSKRLQAAREAGLARLPALVHDAAELPDQQAFLLAVYDNLGCRPYNAVEKGRILLRLRDRFHYPDERLSAQFCPLLDLPPRLDTVHQYCRLASLDDRLQAATVEGRMPLQTALWIGRQAVEDRQALLNLFTGVTLGTNRAREITSAIEDICRRDDITPSSLLAQLGIAAILAEPQRSGPQKIDRLRRLLQQTRYPLLSAHQERFQKTVQRLALPAQIHLRPPPYFEGAQYQVSFEFASRQELQRYAQRLLDASAHAALDDLLELI